MKERYEELQSEVIEFETADVIITSDGSLDDGADNWRSGNSNAS